MSDWPHKQLGDLLTFLTSGSRGWAKYYAESGALFLRIQNVSGGRVHLDDVAYVQAPDSAEARRTRLQPGDVLLSITADLGRTGVVPDNIGPAHINQHLAILRVEGIDPHFLAGYLASPDGQRQVKRLDRVGVKSGLNFDDVRSLTVPVPPLPEQRRIAAILDKADAIRRKRQETIRLTEELLRSTFLSMFGDPATNPKGWPLKKMNDIVAETQYGTSSPCNELQDGLPILRMNNITYGGDIDLGKIKWCPIGDDDRPKYTVSKGDLLFNRTNSPELVGKCAVWDRDEDYAFAGYLIRVRFEENMANPHYVSGFLNSAYGKRLLFVKAKPSNNMSNFSAGEFIKIPIPVPPVIQQAAYARLVERARGANARRARALAGSDMLFSALVSAAFSGALR